jgi:actin-related protein
MVGVTDPASANSGALAAAAAAADGTAAARRKYYVDQAARIPRAGMALARPVDMGLVEDFDMLEAVWRHGYASLRSDPRDHPVLISEDAFALPAQREKQAEIMFESLGAPALFFAKSPMLQAFSMGRASALVVDIGATATRVVPVVDGHTLHSACTAWARMRGRFLCGERAGKGRPLSPKTVRHG